MVTGPGQAQCWGLVARISAARPELSSRHWAGADGFSSSCCPAAAANLSGAGILAELVWSGASFAQAAEPPLGFLVAVQGREGVAGISAARLGLSGRWPPLALSCICWGPAWLSLPACPPLPGSQWGLAWPGPDGALLPLC